MSGTTLNTARRRWAASTLLETFTMNHSLMSQRRAAPELTPPPPEGRRRAFAAVWARYKALSGPAPNAGGNHLAAACRNTSST